jgi:hypothetical protein
MQLFSYYYTVYTFLIEKIGDEMNLGILFIINVIKVFFKYFISCQKNYLQIIIRLQR